MRYGVAQGRKPKQQKTRCDRTPFSRPTQSSQIARTRLLSTRLQEASTVLCQRSWVSGTHLLGDRRCKQSDAQKVGSDTLAGTVDECLNTRNSERQSHGRLWPTRWPPSDATDSRRRNVARVGLPRYSRHLEWNKSKGQSHGRQWPTCSDETRHANRRVRFPRHGLACLSSSAPTQCIGAYLYSPHIVAKRRRTQSQSSNGHNLSCL